MPALTVVYLVLVLLYWYPATLFQWGSYGTFDDGVPLAYQLVRLLTVGMALAALIRRPTLSEKHLLYFVFSAWSISVSALEPTVVSGFLVFWATVLFLDKIDYSRVSLDRILTWMLPPIYATGLLEILGIVVSPHTYGDELRVVATFGGPNNAGIIFAAFSIYFLLKLKRRWTYASLIHFACCTGFVILTGSLSAALALGLCTLYLQPVVAVVGIALVSPFLLVNDFFVLKLHYLSLLLSGQDYGTASFGDRIGNTARLFNLLSNNTAFLFFGSGDASESDLLGVLGHSGIPGVMLFLLVIFTLPRNIFMALGLLQSLVTPFFWSFPSFQILAFLACYTESERSLATFVRIRTNHPGVLESPHA
jgi:hypothetical protein